jgi:hypothetical protein
MIDLLPTPGAPVDFPFAEKTVRQKIGLPKDDMRALRREHLNEAEFIIHKKALYLSAGAVEKLWQAAAQFGAQSRPAQSSSEGDPLKSEVSKKTAPPETLLVVNTQLANRHMLHCCRTDDNPYRPKKMVRVRVRTQEGFRIRMEIIAQLVAGYDDLYDLVSKYPRKKTNL